MKPSEQNTPSRAPLPATPQTFILEPILTPSGIIDAGDDGVDLAIADLEIDFENIDLAEAAPEATDAVSDLPDDLQELPWLEQASTTPTQASDLFDSGVFTVGESGEVEFDFLFDGGKYKGELGVFSLEGMEQFEPGSEDFIQEAARRALSGSEDGHVVISDRYEGAKFSGDLGEPKDWNTGEYWEDKPAFTMRPGDRFGLIFVPNGSMEQVWENPNIGGSKAPLFSMSTANPDDFFHMGQIADVTGEGHTFVLEDMRISAGSDGDYNDFVFQVRGATSDSTSLEELAANHHWNGSEIGQEILDYTDQSIAEYEALIEQQTEQMLADIDAAIEELLPDGSAADVEAVPEAEVEAALEAEVQSLTDELTATDDRLIDDLEPTIADADATFATLSDRAIEALEQTLAQPSEAEPDAIATLAKTYQFAPEDQPVIGILDTDFTADNPDINTDNLTVGNDFIEGDSDPFVAPSTAKSHGTTILETIAAIQDNDLGQDGINDDVRLWLARSTGSGRWAEALVDFVEAAKQSGQPNAIANLSFDLTQIDSEGNVSTRLDLTANERAALEYARANNVLVVAAAGNNNGAMSALGQASSEFENLITVGAAEGGDRADYSSYGEGLDLLAPGQAATGESGSSIAAAKVSGIASLAWAANPELSAAEIAEILTATATDLDAPGWDATTGMGLVNLAAAVTAAKAATPTGLPSEATIPPPSFSPPESSASERATFWPSRFKPVQQRLRDAMNRAKQRAAAAVRQRLSAATSRLASAGRKRVGNFVSRVRNTFSSATNVVRQGIRRVTAPITNAFKRSAQKFPFVYKLKNNVSGLVNRLKDAFNKLIGQHQDAKDEEVQNNGFHATSFSGWVGPGIGVALRNSPNHDDKSGLAEPYRKTLYFDGWMYGGVVSDLWTNQPDALWYRYWRDGKAYWVPSAYIYGYPSPRPPLLPPSNPTPPPPPPPPTEPGYVNSNIGSVSLNFRSGAYVGATIIGRLGIGTKVEILEKVTGGLYQPGNRNDWYKVKVGSKTGYVAAYFITKGNPPATSSWQNPLPGYPVTSGYGWRRDPATGQQKFHYGIDIGAPYGTPIKAAKSGTIIKAGWDTTGYGNLVIIQHDDGTRSYYAHMSGFSVGVNQRVSAGQRIGSVGSTGYSTGNHLHFEIRVAPYRWQTDNRNPRNYVNF